MRARVAQDEIADRVGNRLQETLGDSARQRNAKCVAIAARVFGCDPPFFFRDGDLDDSTRFREFGDPLTRASRTLSPRDGERGTRREPFSPNAGRRWPKAG